MEVKLNMLQLNKITELAKIHGYTTSEAARRGQGIKIEGGVTHDAGHTSENWATITIGSHSYKLSDNGNIV